MNANEAVQKRFYADTQRINFNLIKRIINSRSHVSSFNECERDFKDHKDHLQKMRKRTDEGGERKITRSVNNYLNSSSFAKSRMLSMQSNVSMNTSLIDADKKAKMQLNLNNINENQPRFNNMMLNESHISKRSSPKNESLNLS